MTSPIGEAKANNALSFVKTSEKSHRNFGEGGFTLVEILLVIIIIGIISALAAPNFSKGYSGFQLNQTTDDLLNISRWAQAMAIGQERTYALSFSPDRRSYGLVRAKITEGADDQNSFEPINGSLGQMHTIPDAIRLLVTQPKDSQGTGDIDRIQFYPDGTIDPETIQLSSHDQKTVLSSTQVRGMMTKVSDE
jgi:prepilin-type N-terminal cleavage/methylation domain-containing protein